MREHEKKRALRIAIGISGGMCALAAATGFAINLSYFDKYSSATPGETSASEIKRWKQNSKAGFATGIVGTCGTVLALTGFSLTFFLKRNFLLCEC